MKFPITVNGKDYEVQEYTDGDEKLVVFGDRNYKVWSLPNDLCYFMIKAGGTQRSVRSSPDKILEAIIRVSLIYKNYDNRVRQVKEEAQRARDVALNGIIESVANALSDA